MKKTLSARESDKAESLAYLRKRLKEGTTVYCVLQHRSSSGMSREITLVVPRKDGTIERLDWHVERVLGWKVGKYNGIKVSGCGMDMGFHLVYTLSSVLFGKRERAGYMLRSEWI